MNKTIEERFWEKVEVINDEDSCWLWNAYLSPNGYGKICIGEGKSIGAHKYSWELANGQKIPDGLVTRHRCHNPQCVRPSHLTIGTNQDNKNDCTEANRQAKGEEQGMSKLTEEQVQEIRLLRSQGGITKTELSIKYGISKVMICNIIKGKNWKHLINEVNYVPESDYFKGEKHGSAKLTEEKVREIRSRFANGTFQSVLANEYRVSLTSIHKVVYRKSWKHI